MARNDMYPNVVPVDATQTDVDRAFEAWRNLALAIDTHNPNDRALVENHWRAFCKLDDEVNGPPHKASGR